MVRYVSYADIISNAFGASAFHSVSNGAVNVDCARVNTHCVDTRCDGSEKAVDTTPATCRSIIDKLKARESKLDALIQELQADRLSRPYPRVPSRIGPEQFPSSPETLATATVSLDVPPIQPPSLAVPPPRDSPPITAKQKSVSLHIMAQPPEQPATPTPPSTMQPMMAPPHTKDAPASAALHAAAADSAAILCPLPSADISSRNPQDKSPYPHKVGCHKRPTSWPCFQQPISCFSRPPGATEYQ